MAKIVVVGGGIGGLAGAYELRHELGASHEVILVNEREDFWFTPSNPWVAVGWREAREISFPIRIHAEKKGIRFIAKRVDHIDPERQILTLADGSNLNFDYLVIVTGPKLAFDDVPGAGPEGFTQSVCTLDHALKTRLEVDQLLKQPGPVIVGALPGASCFGPAYEYLMILETVLRRAKKRHKVPMTYVTSEPYVGHLGLGGVGDSKGMMESLLRDRSIKWICNARTTRIEQGRMFVEELNTEGQVVKNHELPFVHSMMLPAFKGVDAVAQVPGLCNPRGFVLIDAQQRSVRYPNIYSAGVCVAIPPVEVTPVPTGAPKTGYMIESMMTTIATNIKTVLGGEPAVAEASWNAFCLADFGDTGAAFVAVPQLPPRNTTWYKKGVWAHWAKVGFEKYFLLKMKKGMPEPLFERLALKVIGLKRIDPDLSRQ